MKRIIYISFLCCFTCLLFSCGHYSSGSSLRIYAVVNVSYSRNLSFYAKQAGNQSFFPTINVSEDCWNDKVMTDFYELYLIKDSCIVKRYLTL